jgi:hypothetical protein
MRAAPEIAACGAAADGGAVIPSISGDSDAGDLAAARPS